MTEQEARAMSAQLRKLFPDATPIEHCGGGMDRPPFFKWPPGWKVEFTHGAERKHIFEFDHGAAYAARCGLKISRPKSKH